MKKRIMVTLLVLCAVVCALSITALAAEPEPVFVAQIGETKFESIQAAVDAAQDGDTIVVIESHELGWEDTVLTADGIYTSLVVVNDKSITLDWNGKTISVEHLSTTDRIYSVIHVADGASLTVTGNGGIDAIAHATTPKIGYMFWKRGTTGTLTIENGTYHMNHSEDSMIYTNGNEIVTVNGGSFTLDSEGTGNNGSPWIFNVKGQNEGHISINGGTFNADVNHQYWAHEVTVPNNKALQSNGKIDTDERWTVVDSVAYTAESDGNHLRYVGYANLEEAVAAAGDEFGMVALLDNCTVSDTITIGTNNISIYCDADVEGVTVSRSNTCDAIFDFENGKKLVIDPTKNIHCPGDANATPGTIARATPAKLTFAQDVTEWCVNGYVAVENDAGLYEVVEGWKVSYYVAGDETPVYIEGVATGGTAQGYTHVVEGVEEDNAIFDWYTDDELTTPYDFNTTVSENISLYGALVPAVIVDFDSDEGTEVDRQVIEADPENNTGVQVEEPAPPTKENSTFAGWYADAELTEEFDFDTPITDSTDIYAKWIDDSVVRFETSGGSVVEDVYVPYGEKLEKPRPDPSKSGYTFGGWYVDAELTEEYDFDADIEEESVFTLYAKWNEVVYAPAYTVDAPAGVKISPAYAYPGATVTVTIEDADLDGVRILDSKGNLVRVNGSNGVFKFVMPYGDVKVEPFALPFDDVSESDYFHDAVIWAYANGITSGTTESTFSPDDACTRGQMVTFLWNTAGAPAPFGTGCPFEDVDLDSYYGKAVLWAVEKGLINGTSATAYSPDEVCSRAQMAALLCRMEKGLPAGNATPFTDVAADAYYADSVLWAYEAGIVNGTGGGNFSPEALCSRAHMVTFLYRCYGK